MSASSTLREDSGARPSQGELALEAPRPLLRRDASLAVLDLFAGIGGLSAGFQAEGFTVTGVDAETLATAVYSEAGFGQSHTVDLGTELFHLTVPVVIGGPPCRPWSAVNLQRRRAAHSDHGLLMRYVEHVRAITPAMFVMENVPALGSDDVYADGVRVLRSAGYGVESRILHYDRFGAATRRRRLFTVGVRGNGSGAAAFFAHLAGMAAAALTVGDAIRRFRDLPRDGFPDHDWSDLKTIGKYRERYETGQYGWRRLDYTQPAPSFGSVAKTYILHPEAGRDGYPERVISVREAMAIMGFPDSMRFPPNTPRAKRYQMVANAVSPQVSRAVASAVRAVLCGP